MLVTKVIERSIVSAHPADSPFLPSSDQCGIESSDRVLGGEVAGLSEFPWMVLVEYQKDNGQRGFYCGGVLISSKYILTAAHCIKGKDLPRSWKLVSVRLGEFNTENDTDCVHIGNRKKPVCAPPPLNIPVEETIAHESYNPYDVNQYHDIGLLRLAREVTMSAFVKPICLPKSSFDQAIEFSGKNLTVAGWGSTGEKMESPVKMKLVVINLNVGQLCAGGVKNKDSCRGDSGGPLMSLYADEMGEINWYSIGVVSFGPSPCGMENWPGVYTKVANYVPWIVSKLRGQNKGVFNILDAQELCLTPVNSRGDCKSIEACPRLYKMLTHRPITRQDANYLRDSMCGFEGRLPKVCCPFDEPEVTTTRRPYEFDNGSSLGVDLLPSKVICGFNVPDRIYGGKEADLNEFPWMALIQYQRENGRRGFYCGGVLINSRYVLTAAHCVKGKDIPRSWKIVGVRLGEYDTESDIDCKDNGLTMARQCAPPPVDVPVEERIAHEQYDPYNSNQYNDIALLRLSRDVKFTDYVRPVCLPRTASDRRKSFVGKTLTVAGWGKTEKRSESSVKLKLDIPVRSNQECGEIYESAGVTLNGGQLCAGGEKGKDSCRGDSGGPLMTLYEDENGEINWYSIGVVSFGPSPCGMENWPGVYTKVADFVPWIISKLRL
ncbi:unnamed protein product [Phaedon cochleariae]|uniref:CLIP domain-containing serine protease n=1 Tax=Phaedon cochleariae TaxID=80249 RepID=A0A9N9SL19_PHACE|nr:unnamed protein product [Phaedon cochleariae]